MSTASAAVPATGTLTRRPRILMVDDQPARLLSYEAILSGLGVECVRALSGLEALHKLLEGEFAVILLDVNMPGMDGFEVARLIREHPRLERTPIIFITAIHGSELDRLKGYAVGAIDYIAVPVVPEILRGKVAVLIELYERRSELQEVNRALAEARLLIDAQHARALAVSHTQLKAIFEHPSEVVLFLEPMRDEAGAIQDWTYRNANSNALRYLGRTREELVGRRVSEVLPERAQRDMEICTRVLEAREPTRYETRWSGTDFLVTVFAVGDDCVVSSGVDISDRKRAEAAREQLEEKLRLADRRKDDFLAMLAHELRNPVAPIMSASEALARLLVNEEKGRDLVGIVRRQTLNLSRLLDDLLDMARITQGRIQLRAEAVPLETCIDMALEIAQPLIRERRHQLTIGRTRKSVHVDADGVRLAQCLANLLTNAAKYTDVGGEIRISPSVEGEHAVIEVTDNGIGIAPDFLPQVFELFAQSDRSLDRAQGGLGIGLSVCRKLIEMQGGTVGVHSAGLGHGSTFTLRIPVATRGPERARTTPHVEARQRVLVVDDNRDAADALALLLDLAGHDVRTVYSADAALREWPAFAPGIALLDIGLPGMDGYELARRIRATAGVSVKLVALSGYGQAEDKARSAQAGFDAHLVKPVAVAELEQIFTG